MNGFLRKVIAALLALFLVSCIGVTVGLRYSRDAALYFMLGAGVLCFVALLLLFGIRRKKTEPQPVDPPVADTPGNGKHLLAEQYTRMLTELSIPEDAQNVTLPTALFAPCVANVLHYFWRAEEDLVMFPRWDSIESCMELLGYLEQETDQYYLPLNLIRIPLDSIDYYTVLTPVADGETYTMLIYRGQLGDWIGLCMREDAYPALKTLLPELDLDVMRMKEYPASAKQISDISTKMQQLKELYTQALITDEEYKAKKSELLILL